MRQSTQESLAMPDSDATRPSRAIRGVLFDKDGTLLDYAATWMGANRAAALAAAGGDRELGERLLVIGGYDPDRDRVGANTALAAGNATEIAAVWLPHVNGWEPRDLADLLAFGRDPSSESTCCDDLALGTEFLANPDDHGIHEAGVAIEQARLEGPCRGPSNH